MTELILNPLGWNWEGNEVVTSIPGLGLPEGVTSALAMPAYGGMMRYTSELIEIPSGTASVVWGMWLAMDNQGDAPASWIISPQSGSYEPYSPELGESYAYRHGWRYYGGGWDVAETLWFDVRPSERADFGETTRMYLARLSVRLRPGPEEAKYRVCRHSQGIDIAVSA